MHPLIPEAGPVDGGPTNYPIDALAVLARSRERSGAFGLRQDHPPELAILDAGELRLLRERNSSLGSHARPVMENLYAQIAGTHSMVLLTDRHGTILQSLGDADFLERAHRVALQPGVAWSEQSCGTNAIGTSLVEGEPMQVHADQHFLRVHHFLSCSCAPIHDPLGEPMGSIDVSGDHRGQSKHTLALVRMSAQMIENHLFSRHFDEAVQLHFHSRPEFLGTLLEGMAAFDADGRFLSANRSALFQLGMSLRALQAHTFSSLFGRPISDLMGRARRACDEAVDLWMPGGVKVAGRARLRRAAALLPVGTIDQPSPASAGSRPVARTGSTASPAHTGLEALRTGDAAVSALIDRLQRLAGRDIAVLILGETGTGKEVLARAIHRDSPRAAGPLVAVNCAALPEHLIESELFGYEEGAFTGARRKGSPGRILQANGGTLFLDEIGDMPLALQARLLRVLQEREVTPLGGGRPLPVDVAIVCATHRDLRALRAAGTFRDDLYWRINGLVVRLPALRERSDLPVIAQRLLQAESAMSGSPAPRLDDEVLDLFARHPWPGNLRQLASLLHTAVALNWGATRLGVRQLPEDFLDDLDIAAAWPTTPSEGLFVAEAHGCRDAFSLQTVTASAIEQAMRTHGGNVSAAARALGVARNTVYRRLRQR
ncbi:sigma-54-dependent Fis family transcriptional regulator [Xylophilus sp. GOD-11R]|uniref:sigma-54-dependent Fis family transcriptional regulator n=1 Tax=Xylophilus sp. GOD-11R TaxID=3089814 RepID=UPI00298BFED8|nr:sigma-54-dependent Fis family transcriptional regulator [Xylophilus sp. GOD-11R]WPB57512.1 sigma-54-dependent Fis family transcriptional regulator [Xylophilus sp. GOD-11R]